jgi:hypothetical protein
VAAVSLMAAGAELAHEDPRALITAGHDVGTAVLPVPGAAAPPLPATGGGTDVTAGELTRPHPLDPAERRSALRALLAAAAARHGLDPGLVMAVAWWESGWDMTKVSSTGAVGIMQIDPATASELGPKLLGRPVDVHDPYDNADLGAAVLKADLEDANGDLAVALASYYEGAANVDPSNLDPGAQTYVDGVTSLQKQFDAGQDPGR